MQPIIKTDSCPHCGGTTGFMTNAIYKATRLTAWDGQDADTDNYQLSSETNPKCGDCGKGLRSLFAAKAA